MTTKKILILAIAASLALGVSCASESKRLIKKGLYNCSARLETARQRMNKKNYANALRIFEEIKYQCGGSEVMDTVIYLTAMSHFRLKQYIDARDEFEILQREHPRSPFIEEAYYRIGHMRYLQSRPFFRDQSETREAIRYLGDYLDMYPNGAYSDSARALTKISIDRLAEKEFQTARFYLRQKEHEAALIYYRALLTEYPESSFAPEAAVGMTEMLLSLGRIEDAKDVLEDIDPSAFDDKLKERLTAVKQKLGV